MEKFLLLVREDLKQIDNKSPEEFSHDIMAMTRWIEGLSQSGNFASGEALQTTGRYITKDSVTSDGPFIEAKEAVSGYIMIHAGNLEQAASICQTCPLVLTGKLEIEIRPIYTFNRELHESRAAGS
jgi:hypothetical protein